MIKWMRRALLALGIVVAVAAAVVAYAVHDLPDALQPPTAGPSAVLFDDVRLVSMAPGAPDATPAQAVLVVGDRIVEVGAAGTLSPPEGARVVAAAGRTLIPGLIDAHVHISDEAELAGYLAHGVTAVRNLSGYPFHLPLAERIARGELLGPGILTTGPILNSHGPNENLLQQIVGTAEEARDAVQAQYDAGYRRLKVYSNLTREAYEAILGEAGRLGMSVTGHSPEGVRGPGVPRDQPFDIPWEASVGRGFTTLEHVETLVWHALRDDLDIDKMRGVAQRLAASGDVVTPTLIAHARLVRIAETRGGWLERPGSDSINPLVRLVDQGAESYWSQMDPTGYEIPHAAFFLQATGLLHEAGVPLVAGSDAGGFGLIPGAALARELELLVQAGLTPHEALAAATRVSAIVLGFEGRGVIAPGYRADLLLLAEDPLRRVGAVDAPDGVMVGGHWLDAEGLDRMRAAARDTSLLRSAWRAVQFRLSL